MNKSNIALVGFMGAGKTTVGRIVASRLGAPFIELDDEIAAKAGKPVQKIITEDGEPAFRELERDAVAKAARAHGTVISCGGGVVLSSANVEALKKTSSIILLAASDEETVRRVGDVSSRPLLNRGDPLERIRELKAVRREAYDRAADVVIDTTGLPVVQVASLVISAAAECRARGE